MELSIEPMAGCVKDIGFVPTPFSFSFGKFDGNHSRRIHVTKWGMTCILRQRPRSLSKYELQSNSRSSLRASVVEESNEVDAKVLEFPERFFESYEWRGFKINYFVQGPTDGIPVLFVHGFGASINHWRKNIPAFLNTEKYRVYAIDLLGLGASAKPNPRQVTYNIELWTEQVVDFVQRMDSQRPWAFIGNSIGSLISIAAVDELGKDRVRCCALMNCAGGMVSFRYSELNPFQRIIFFSFNSLLFNPIVGKWLFQNIRKPENLSNVLKQIYIDQTAITDELLNILSTPAFDDGALEVFLAILNGEPGPRPEEILQRIEWCPMLVLWGEKDPWTPLNEGFHPGIRFPDYHSGLILQSIPNAGHCIHDEVPDIVNTALVPFVQSPKFRD